jgi:hypothetical protein
MKNNFVEFKRKYLQEINDTTLIRNIFGVMNIQLNISTRKIPVHCDSSRLLVTANVVPTSPILSL